MSRKKDRPANKQSLNDMVGENKKNIGAPKKFFGWDANLDGKETDTEFADVEKPKTLGEALKGKTPVINDKALLNEEKEAKEYNAKVTELDELYSSLTPVSKIIVRCFVNEPKRTDSGLILKTTKLVSVPTQNGMGSLGEVETPYPYTKRAVVVAIPPVIANNPNNNIKVGSTVQLSDDPLKIKIVNKDATMVDMPYAFTHYSWEDPMPPKSKTNRHYGYLLVPQLSIDTIE